jgi:hypothetical protein
MAEFIATAISVIGLIVIGGGFIVLFGKED